VRAALLVLIAAACSYGDPDYSGTSFKCDDSHGCPDNHRCVNNVCAALGGGANGVVCGDDLTCAVGETCCIDGTNGPRCLGIGESCPGRAALCDGVEDCALPAHCCEGVRAACSSLPQCAAICRDNADCPGLTPNCCRDDAAVPWSHCSFEPC
jgi:hypothetical protein